MGRRGEGWVAAQLVLLAAVAVAPPSACAACPSWLRVVGLLLLALGTGLGSWGLWALGRNLTPFPQPLDGGELVTHGPYRVVRHPLYAALVLAAAGWALARTSGIGLVLAAALFALLDRKSRREEAWLEEAYPGYAAYRERVRRLVPWVY